MLTWFCPRTECPQQKDYDSCSELLTEPGKADSQVIDPRHPKALFPATGTTLHPAQGQVSGSFIYVSRMPLGEGVPNDEHFACPRLATREKPKSQQLGSQIACANRFFLASRNGKWRLFRKPLATPMHNPDAEDFQAQLFSLAKASASKHQRKRSFGSEPLLRIIFKVLFLGGYNIDMYLGMRLSAEGAVFLATIYHGEGPWGSYLQVLYVNGKNRLV